MRDEEARRREDDDDPGRSRHRERSLLRGSVVFVKEKLKQNEMTEKAGSGNGAVAKKLVKGICR